MDKPKPTNQKQKEPQEEKTEEWLHQNVLWKRTKKKEKNHAVKNYAKETYGNPVRVLLANSLCLSLTLLYSQEQNRKRKKEGRKLENKAEHQEVNLCVVTKYKKTFRRKVKGKKKNARMWVTHLGRTISLKGERSEACKDVLRMNHLGGSFVCHDEIFSFFYFFFSSFCIFLFILLKSAKKDEESILWCACHGRGIWRKWKMCGSGGGWRGEMILQRKKKKWKIWKVKVIWRKPYRKRALPWTVSALLCESVFWKGVMKKKKWKERRSSNKKRKIVLFPFPSPAGIFFGFFQSAKGKSDITCLSIIFGSFFVGILGLGQEQRQWAPLPKFLSRAEDGWGRARERNSKPKRLFFFVFFPYRLSFFLPIYKNEMGSGLGAL